jgi:hypothetical protein
MNVVIEDLSPGVERNGLTKSQLQTGVESQLRQSGIRVDDTAPAYLYVAATSILKDGATYVYSIDVEFNQSVVILRTGERATGSTWSTSSLGFVGLDNFSQSVRNLVQYLVVKFIDAYLSVNPKR